MDLFLESKLNLKLMPGYKAGPGTPVEDGYRKGAPQRWVPRGVLQPSLGRSRLRLAHEPVAEGQFLARCH